MAQLIDIQKVVIGPDAFTATVRVADSAPLSTSEDVEATARVYWLMPHIAEQVCVGDGGETFKDVMGDTSIVHLLEHVTLEFLAQTNIAGEISQARTREIGVPRTYEMQFACPDDVLVASALSSAVWVLQWAFGSADDASKPNTEAIVEGIVNLTQTSYTMEGNEAPLPPDLMAPKPLSPASTGTFTVPEVITDEEGVEEVSELTVPDLSGRLQGRASAFELESPGRPSSEPLAAATPEEIAVEAAMEEIHAESAASREADALAGLDLVIHHAQEAENRAAAPITDANMVGERYGVVVDEKKGLRIREEGSADLGATVGFMDINDEDPLGGDLD